MESFEQKLKNDTKAKTKTNFFSQFEFFSFLVAKRIWLKRDLRQGGRFSLDINEHPLVFSKQNRYSIKSPYRAYDDDDHDDDDHDNDNKQQRLSVDEW